VLVPVPQALTMPATSRASRRSGRRFIGER
jgi:hypothetical protein